MTSAIRMLPVTLVLSLSAFLTGCQSEVPVTPEEAQEIAEQALNGFNAGDYEAWTAEWSPELKAAISEEDFQTYRNDVMETSGKWISIQNVSASSPDAEGRFSYVFDTRFEKAPFTMRMVFPEDGAAIESVSLEERRRNTPSEPAESWCPPYLNDKCHEL